MAADVSAPILVYEKPRFNEPMFVKARDAPLDSSPGDSKSSSFPKEISAEKAQAVDSPSKKETLLRRLSMRSRSQSMGKMSLSSEPRRSSLLKHLPRRLSGLFRTRSMPESSFDTAATKGDPKIDDLVVYSEEV